MKNSLNNNTINTCELFSNRNTTDNDGQQVLQVNTREGQKKSGTRHLDVGGITQINKEK